MITKWGQFTKVGPFSTFQLLKLSKLCYLLLSSFENENNFFLISLDISRLLPFGIYWPINFAKKIYVSVYLSLNRDIHSGDSWPYISFFWPKKSQKCLVVGQSPVKNHKRLSSWPYPPQSYYKLLKNKTKPQKISLKKILITIKTN